MATLEQDALSLQRISYMLGTKASTDTATADTAGLVKIGSNISNSNGTISISKDNVTNALGYTPPTSDTTYNVGTTSAAGLTKLYNSTGTNTDGTITQAAIKSLLDGKLDSNATAQAAVKDNAGNVITDTYVTKTQLSNMFRTPYRRYGYRIKKAEADPFERVEYLYDAAGMTPAKMVYEVDGDSDSAYFDYGSWADVWFVKDNKPLMLKSDGTVDYYLNPNDYSKKENGDDSDVANTDYDGNAMAQIPLCWVKRYEDNDYYYEVVSNIQYDFDYQAYAHTDKNGTIKDYCYHAMFTGSGSASKIRSLSGQTFTSELTTANMFSGAAANGSGWYIDYWSQHELIRTLLVLIGKSTNTQAVFGSGGGSRITGALDDKGQFFGYNAANEVKVFHIEKPWCKQSNRCAGLINNKGTIYVKMTPEGSGYRVSDVTGYTKAGTALSVTTPAFISAVTCNDFGMIPIKSSGSNSTYFCDTVNSNLNNLCSLLIGHYNGLQSGAFAFHVNAAHDYKVDLFGCALTYV